MVLRAGDKLPAHDFMVMSEAGPKKVSTQELCGVGRTVFFAVPGAFTPTCSAKHLPGFVEKADKFAAKGVARIACVSVNDVFVMDAWGKAQGAGDDVLMLADGNGSFAKLMGLEMDASGFGMGTRSQRYAMVVDDCVITSLYVEAPGNFEVSSADYVLSQL